MLSAIRSSPIYSRNSINKTSWNARRQINNGMELWCMEGKTRRPWHICNKTKLQWAFYKSAEHFCNPRTSGSHLRCMVHTQKWKERYINVERRRRGICWQKERTKIDWQQVELELFELNKQRGKTNDFKSYVKQFVLIRFAFCSSQLPWSRRVFIYVCWEHGASS